MRDKPGVILRSFSLSSYALFDRAAPAAKLWAANFRPEASYCNLTSFLQYLPRRSNRPNAFVVITDEQEIGADWRWTGRSLRIDFDSEAGNVAAR